MARSRPPARTTRQLSERDYRVLQLVGQFKQLTAHHVKQLLFHDVGATPVYRSLERLTELKYLASTERLVASGRGGSGRYVYSLTRDGFNLLYIGDYARARVKDTMHTLAIADCAVTLRELERAGKLHVTALLTEPECHVRIGGYNLHPDLFIELERGGKRAPFWFEVQRSYKSPKNLDLKFRAYHYAYRHAYTDYREDEEMPAFPVVIVVAMYPESASIYRGVIANLPAEAQQLFRVTTVDGLASLFG